MTAGGGSAAVGGVGIAAGDDPPGDPAGSTLDPPLESALAGRSVAVVSSPGPRSAPLDASFLAPLADAFGASGGVPGFATGTEGATTEAGGGPASAGTDATADATGAASTTGGGGAAEAAAAGGGAAGTAGVGSGGGEDAGGGATAGGGGVAATGGAGVGAAGSDVSESSVAEELATIGSMAPHDLQKRRVASFASPQSGHRRVVRT